MADDQKTVVLEVPSECTEAIDRALKNSEFNKIPGDDPFARAINGSVNHAIVEALAQELPVCGHITLPNNTPFSLVPKIPANPLRNR